jgi:DNA-binding response OmpR family regulator
MPDLILVDDDTDARDTLRDCLVLQGYDVRVAGDGAAGLELLGTRLPDLALLDVEMPELSGPQMAYRMFVDDCGREKIPIIFLSGAVDLQLIAERVGTTYYLPKPFSLRVLDQMIDRALRERTAPTYPDGGTGLHAPDGSAT